MYSFVRLLAVAVFVIAETSYAVTFRYVSPVPNAMHVTAQSNIILGQSDSLDRNIIHSGYIQVSGNVSGEHPGRLILSDDDQTLIFFPSTPFIASERVTVNFLGGMPTLKGKTIDAMTFSFRVSPNDNRTPLPSFSLSEKLGWNAHEQPQSHVTSRPISKTLEGDSIPDGFPVINVSLNNSTNTDKFFLSNMSFTSASNVPFLMILDPNANISFARRMSMQCLDFKVQPNGLLTYFDSTPRYFFGLDSTMNIVASYRCGNGYPTDVHDLQLLPNGHALLMGEDQQVIDMSVIVPGGNPSATVKGLIVQEIDGNQNVVFQWRSWDHFRITDATHEDLTAPSIDYVHGNAVELDKDGNILISSRHMDEITKIDRTTGNIIWRFGGKNNQFTFTNDSIGFSHQHALRRLPSGNVTLFDNGNFHSPSFSRAIEYNLDEQGKIATLVWQYRPTPDVYSSFMGYVQRFENGNTLIGWGGVSSPAVTEVRPNGTKVFEMSLPDGVVSYRAYKLPWGSQSTASTPNGRAPGSFSLSQNYPNPFNPSTTITYDLVSAAHTTLKVYNVLGQEIETLVDERKEAGRYAVVFDAKHYTSGVYFYTLNAGANIETRKMLLLK